MTSPADTTATRPVFAASLRPRPQRAPVTSTVATITATAVTGIAVVDLNTQLTTAAIAIATTTTIGIAGIAIETARILNGAR